MTTQTESQITVYSVGICFASVCTALTDVAEIEMRLNMEQPTGVGRWRLHDEPFRSGEPNPCECNDQAGRKHYLFSC